MELGAIIGLADQTTTGAIADECRRLVAEGYESLWVAHAIGRGRFVPDPLQTLAVAATATDDVTLGTAIVQVPLYHPVDLAHRVLSLRQLCGDRLVLGIGSGSTAADFAAVDRNHRDRFDEFATAQAVLRRTLETGRWGATDLTPPEPSSSPPVHFGTWGAGVDIAARDYDGWIASGMYRTPDQLDEAIGRFRAAGGTQATVSTVLVGPDADEGEVRDRLDRYAAAGFDRGVVLVLPGRLDSAAVRNLHG